MTTITPTHAVPPTPPAPAAPAHGPGQLHAPGSPEEAYVPPAPGAVEGEPVPPYLDPEVVRERLKHGRVAELTEGTLPPGVIARGAPEYFRTYEQLKTAMYELAEQHPDLVQVRDIGDTVEKQAGTADRDVLALVLTNTATGAPGTKPASMHTGGVHSREIANPELLMSFAEQLVDGYGRDPEATYLLDEREVVLVPMANPDGHAVVERGFAKERGGNPMHRKNTGGSDGVDINRNFEYHWGGPGASRWPSSQTYRGPSAGSEPETKAVQGLMAEREPGVYVDWHSYSELNLFPWGDTRDKSPDHDAYVQLAHKFSSWNGYTPTQSVNLYPTSGTTNDHAYGRHGSAALAVETGRAFHQSDDAFRETLDKNLPILAYTTKIADDPMARVFGPDAVDVLVDPDTREVTASLSDVANGRQAIAGAELLLDPKAEPGTGLPLVPADGTFDSPEERVTGDASRLLEGSAGSEAGDGAADGARLVYVRGRDADGNWGPLTPQWLGDPARG